MLRATAIIRKPAVKPDRVADTVTLDHEGRHRRRAALKGEGGLDFLLDLDKAAVLNDDPAITRILVARGVSLNDTAWMALRCHAGSRAAAVLDEAKGERARALAVVTRRLRPRLPARARGARGRHRRPLREPARGSADLGWA